MKRYVLMCTGFACCSTVMAGPQRVPQAAPPATKVDPIAIATIRRVDGRLVRTSDWLPYHGASSRETGALVFDCFQPDEDHAPTGGQECDDNGGSYRWWFGSEYHAPACAEDMVFDVSAGGSTVNEYSLASGYQVVGGTPADTSFAIAVFTYEEMIDNADCASSSVGLFPDAFTPASDGFIANFGALPQGNWYANIDSLNDLGMLLPGDGEGSYEQISLWIDDISGDLFLAPAAISPFLWGTSDDGGFPDRPGTQDIQGYYDDGGGVGEPDLVYDAGSECYDMTSGVCPDPLGNMAALWMKSGKGLCPADYDGDGFITGIDFDLFVADFEAGCLDDTPPCTSSADQDGDGFITGIDFDLFVVVFEDGCLL